MNKNIIIGMCMFIILVSSVSAFGVAPSRELIPYDTQEHTFTVRVLDNDNANVAIYLKGELSEYATLDTDTLTIESNEKSFTYTIRLPEGLSPGQKTLDVMVAQVPDEPASGKATVNAGLIAIHQLKVDVPYPGEFIDGDIYVSNSKKGEPIVFTVSLINKGTQKTDANVDIIIKGLKDEEIKRLNLGNVAISTSSQSKIEGHIINELEPGEYIAEAVISYGGKTKSLEKNFHSGDMMIDINTVSVKDFKLGTVAKFYVGIENKWNQPLEMYADMIVSDEQGNEIEQYKTGTMTIDARNKDIINTYWDTEGEDVGNYNIKVILNYAGKTSEKMVGVVVGINEIIVMDGISGRVISQDSNIKENRFNIVVILLIILISVNIGWFVYFKKMRKPPSTPPRTPPQSNIPLNNQI